MQSWQDFFRAESSQPYYRAILEFIDQQRHSGKVIYPSDEHVFNAFNLTPLKQVRVVILGQDPYHGAGQAHGLCFSVQHGVAVPPSLKNIYKELSLDLVDFQVPQHGNLTNWAQQGVFLLNTVLTVEQGKAHSHAKIGWETFTDKVIETLSENVDCIVFLLWGSHAQKKASLIDRNKHTILCAPHPSPLSAHRGFLGCGHFSEVNTILNQQQLPPIDWQV